MIQLRVLLQLEVCMFFPLNLLGSTSTQFQLVQVFRNILPLAPSRKTCKESFEADLHRLVVPFYPSGIKIYYFILFTMILSKLIQILTMDCFARGYDQSFRRNYWFLSVCSKVFKVFSPCRVLLVFLILYPKFCLRLSTETIFCDSHQSPAIF